MVVAPQRRLSDEEMTVVLAAANILTTAMERLRDEDQMRHDALHDPLTGLANRTLLRDRLQHAIAQSERDHGETGVLFVDLDNFKQVNDVHGHGVGDELLSTLGDRLRSAVRPADTVARMGGDEFVVVCEHTDTSGVLALADRLETAISAPVLAGGARHSLSASIGIALGHEDPDLLLHEADAAVYRAKAAGGARVEVFSRR
jgi:diguanylate cyclase (GGDEF)-like protein